MLKPLTPQHMEFVFTILVKQLSRWGQFLIDTFTPLTNRANLALPPQWDGMTGVSQCEGKRDRSKKAAIRKGEPRATTNRAEGL